MHHQYINHTLISFEPPLEFGSNHLYETSTPPHFSQILRHKTSLANVFSTVKQPCGGSSPSVLAITQSGDFLHTLLLLQTHMESRSSQLLAKEPLNLFCSPTWQTINYPC